MSSGRSIGRSGTWFALILMLPGVSAATPCAASEQILNVRDFGALGDDALDDTDAIAAALRATGLLPKPAVLYFPAGVYRYSRNMTVDGFAMRGAGMSQTILEATDFKRSAWTLTGDSTAITDLTIRSLETPVLRDTRPEACGIHVWDADDFTISRVGIGPVGSAGILVRSSGGSRENFAEISECVITKTLADGVHITRGSRYLEVANNDVTNTGDDFIAVVSYRTDGAASRDIRIINNRVSSQSHGRGISVVGGTDVTIESNRIGPSWGAGIYIASERSYDTFGVSGVTVSGNTLAGVAANQSVGHSAIHLLGRDNLDSVPSSLGVEMVLITGNRIQGAGKGGIYLGSYCSGISLVGNALTDVAGSGIIVAPKTADISIGTSDTTSPPNIIHSCGEYGIVVDPAGGRGVLRICGVRFESINRKGLSHIDAINIGADGTFAAIYVTDNWLAQPSGLFVERLVESKTTLTEAARNASGPTPRAPSSLRLSVEPSLAPNN